MHTEIKNNSNMVLCLVVVTSFISAFMGSATNLAIPSIGAEFGSSASMLGYIATGYLLSTAALTLPFGKLSDQIGKKFIFVFGCLFFGISALLTVLVHSIALLILFRVICGIFSAMIFSTNVAILVDSVPPQKRGAYMGISTAAVYIGLSLGPVLGGYMNHYFGWRSIFIFPGIISIFICIAAFTCLNNQKFSSQDASLRHMDFLGSILYIIIIVGFLLGMSSFTSGIQGKLLLSAALVLGALFVVHENKQQNPLFPMQIFLNNRIFLFSNLAALLHYAATFGLGYMLSIYLQAVMHLSSGVAGMVMLSQPALMAVFSPLAGHLSDKKEPRILSSLGMGITGLGLLIFALFTSHLTIALVVCNLFFIGIGCAFFSSPNTNAVMGSIEKNQTGMASSTLATMRNVGQALSMAVVTLMISTYTGNAPLSQLAPEIITASMQKCFFIFVVCAAVGVTFSLSRGNKAP